MSMRGEDNYDKPVAYDEKGRPLYARPTESQHMDGTPADATGSPQVVYLTRAIEPHQQVIPPEIQKRHNDSVSKYPYLNLSEGEFVISAIKRHPIGLISIWAVVLVAILLVIILPTFIYLAGAVPFTITSSAASSGVVVLFLVIVLLIMVGIVATVVYNANSFFLTNESVTQYIQSSLFSRKNQTISLGNIEDASFRQKGIVQTVMNYGSIRLSTEGEETTYKFTFVSNPAEQIRLLNDAVEAFKNFRPISED